MYAYVDQKRGDLIVDEAEFQAGGNGVGGRTILSGIDYISWPAARGFIFPKTLPVNYVQRLERSKIFKKEMALGLDRAERRGVSVVYRFTSLLEW